MTLRATLPSSICSVQSSGHVCTKFGVAAGPYAVTTKVEVKAGNVASYTIRAEKTDDFYELYAGLYSDEDELVDYQFFRGETMGWETFELQSPKTAKYHAEFWLASYDKTGGCAVGSVMEIKDVKSTKSAAVCANVINPVDVVFLVDGSLSVGEGGFNISKQYVKDVVSKLHVGPAHVDARVALVTFSELAKVQSHLDEGTSKDAINENVDKMPFDQSSTCTAEAIKKVREDVFINTKEGAKKMLVILTDGKPTGQKECKGEYLDKESEKALSEGTDILAIGVGPGINHENLISMTRNEDKVLKVDNYELLVTTVRATSIILCEGAGGQVETPKQTLPSLEHKGDNPSGKLQLCEGDCDKDDDCEGELKCFQRHGYTSVSGCAGLGKITADYCYDPASILLNLTEHDDTWGQEIQHQLGRCEGDCDKDSECNEGLVCFQRDDEVSVPNCRGAGKPGWDYCHLPHLTELGVDPKVFPEGHPALAEEGLGQCQGECDFDSECAEGLTCFQRDEFEEVPGCQGQGLEGWDYCYKPTAD